MTCVCGWGSNSYGQLGVDESESEDGVVLVPKLINFFNDHSSPLVGVACGWNHSVFWCANGLAYSNGLNDYGQLGYSTSEVNHQPEWIKSLEIHSIVHGSCGELHTVLVTDYGLVYTFGSNQYGQLGVPVRDIVKSSVPRHVKGIPSGLQVVRVACGKNHVVVVCSSGHVFTWGANEHGQCGTGMKSSTPMEPQLLDFFFGVPVYNVFAGGDHSIALTVSGTLFSWGKNGFGQLGLGDTVDKLIPTKIEVLCRKSICHVACGESHTLVLTSAGGVYSFGAGSSGQLGHNSFNDECNPKMITELMGTVITQIACGRKHSLAYVSRTGRLYAFGLGASGQLGIDSLEKRNNPILVKGDWSVDRRIMLDEFVKYINTNNKAYFEDDFEGSITYLLKGNSGKETSEEDKGVCIQEVFAGGLGSFATMSGLRSMVRPSIHCMIREGNILYLTQSIVERMVNLTTPVDKSVKILSKVFSSCSCLNASFLKKIEHEQTSGKSHGIYLMSVRNSFQQLASVEKFKKVLLHSIKEYLLKSFPSDMLTEPESLRVFLIIPEVPFVGDPDDMWQVITPFANAVNSLPLSSQKILTMWWSQLPSTFFERNIIPYKNCIKSLLQQKLPETPNSMIFALHESLKSCILILEKLDRINNENDNIVPYSTFYISGLIDKINIKADYINWIQQPTAFSFCKYPFVFDVKVKASLLQIDAERQMHDAVKEAHMTNIAGLVHGNLQIPTNPLLIFNIRREHIVRDTLTQILMHPPYEMKKPLKIKFTDEDADDAGGVRKEFFLLLMKEILDPKYGMFNFHEDTNVIWFRSNSFEESEMFMLIGVICGLAIYNSTIIDFPFPACLYKKLLERPVNLDDLRGLQPEVARGLQEILDYHEDDFKDTFSLTFQLTEQSFGAVHTIDLMPNGGSVEVTQENKEKYVQAYIDYKLNDSVVKEFNAFSHGFHRVCGGQVLNLFHPQELMELVVGSQDYDFLELEEAATYQGEYYHNHPVILRFWEVFRSFTREKKKKFLQFLTGSDKVSIFGMKNMKFIIQPVAVSEDHLPVAHTCFNLLDLPKYSSAEVLREKLTQAIENGHGFALV